MHVIRHGAALSTEPPNKSMEISLRAAEDESGLGEIIGPGV